MSRSIRLLNPEGAVESLAARSVVENTSAFLRLLINEAFARQTGGAARKALIAEAAERHAARGA